jgi:hypothetical protein
MVEKRLSEKRAGSTKACGRSLLTGAGVAISIAGGLIGRGYFPMRFSQCPIGV